MSREEGPVYYREIQKNAYLKRIPSEPSGKLRPLASKKPPLKPMWTLFCVHNGRIPYLEQYPSADSSPTLAHRPLWRACLTTARHVTASVKPHAGEEYDFLVDCDHGPVRMLAPDWDSMQDWVSTLRVKLHELKILSRGENVYCAPPLPAPPRAPARDPTSPLPPTPPVPVQRVPGIEITTQASRVIPESELNRTTAEPEVQNSTQAVDIPPLSDASIDISNWESIENTNSLQQETSTDSILTSDSTTNALPSTSADETKNDVKETKTRVAKICGQNICLDDSILKRNTECTDSDEEFFAEIDRIHESMEDIHLEDQSNVYSRDGYTQRLQVDGERASESHAHSNHHQQQNTNITVIKVSNKPPHTAIPIMGNETNVFDFTFKQQLTVNVNDMSNDVSKDNFTCKQVSNCERDVSHTQLNSDVSNSHTNSNASKDNFTFERVSNTNAANRDNFINIVNTEVCVRNDNRNDNDYGTVFSDVSDYGHLSLTTTVSLTGDVKNEDVKVTDGIYEKLCLASTSNGVQASPLPVKKLINVDKLRKSSLPNLDSNQESTYEYLFPNASNRSTNNVTLNSTESNIIVNGESHTETSTDNSRNTQRNKSQCNITSHSDVSKVTVNELSNRQVESTRSNLTSQNSNVRSQNSQSQATGQHQHGQNAHNQNAHTQNSHSHNAHSQNAHSHNAHSQNAHSQNAQTQNSHNQRTQNLHNQNPNTQNAHTQNGNSQNSHIQNAHSQNAHTQNQVTIGAEDSTRHLERSHSANACDRQNGLRDRLIRRHNISPKRDGKTDKVETQHKPIWRRGLTELSLLSRLRGRGGRRHDNNATAPDRATGAGGGTSPVIVTHRSRVEMRADGSRRRSSSLNNGNSPTSLPTNGLHPLRARQAASLVADQRRGAVIPAAVSKRDPPIFVDYNKQVWIAWWGVGGARCGGRAGDRVGYVRGAAPTDANHARLTHKQTPAPLVDILFHRVPLGKIYVIHKRDLQHIGIKLDNECVITSVEPGSPAQAAGIPPPGRWAVTEVNNRPINLVKGGEEEMHRLSLHGTEVSILIQPAALVKKIRSALKTRTLFG